MSFSNIVKNECCRLQHLDHQERVAQLAAIVRINSTILINQGQVSLELTTENASVARRIYSDLKGLFRMEANIIIQRRTRLKKNIRYVVHIPAQQKIKTFLETVGMMQDSGIPFRPGILTDFTHTDASRRAYVRGLFLGAGSLTDPQRSYHLELVTQGEEFAQAIIDLVAMYGIHMRMSYRKESVVIYLKESEAISDFLAMIGAHKAVMDFEEVRINKSMRNQVNRLVNCETANLSKSVDAGLRQVYNIRKIADHYGLENLPDNLRSTAQARLDYPEASLKELGELMDPPVGKSGMNHRMRKLEELADEYPDPVN